MGDKTKRHKESDVQATPEQEHENRKQQKKFEATLEPSEIEDSDTLERKYIKKQKKEKETPKKECCFESKDVDLLNQESIFVKGFRCSLPKEKIKSALKKYFSSCGLVTNIFVPFHCKTGSPVGYAFINMAKDVEKALKLDGSCLGGKILFVTMAIDRDEYYGTLLMKLVFNLFFVFSQNTFNCCILGSSITFSTNSPLK